MFACTVCSSPVGASIRDGLMLSDAVVLLPLVVLVVLVSLIYQGKVRFLHE